MKTSTRWALIVAVLALVTTVAFARPHGPGHGPGHGPDWSDFAERHDVDGDGQVTPQELAQTDPRFTHLDRDGDGVVTESDFETLRADRAAGMVVFLADADRDRSVDASEWAQFLAAVDTDADGRFVLSDLREAVDDDRPRRRRRGPQDCDGNAECEARRTEREAERSAALDADGDGVLTTADLDLHFARLDANSDGAIAGEEFPGRDRGHGPRGKRGFRGGR